MGTANHEVNGEAGPVTETVTSRPPMGPIERLDSEELRRQQQVTLDSPRRKASMAARGLFALIDALYGKERTLPKFRVLELVARVPYQAWENVAYVTVTHNSDEEGVARRVFDEVRAARAEQDNEQWHLLILEELIEESGEKLGFVRHRVVPQAMAFGYYQLSWLMAALRPRWSYRLNADLEDHAEHEYASFVDENPELETTPYEGSFTEEYGDFDSLADLFRQIGYDERLHKEESEARMEDPHSTR